MSSFLLAETLRALAVGFLVRLQKVFCIRFTKVHNTIFRSAISRQNWSNYSEHVTDFCTPKLSTKAESAYFAGSRTIMEASDRQTTTPNESYLRMLALPRGPKVVPSWGSYIESYKVTPKRNYFGPLGIMNPAAGLCVMVPGTWHCDTHATLWRTVQLI